MCGSARRLEARPGLAAARGCRSLAHQSLRHCASNPSRAPRPGPVDQAARLSETHVAFARACLRGFETAVTFAGAGRASIETGVAFAGEKWAFLVHFSVAVVMPVSAVPCWGRAVVLLVSMSPRCRTLCTKKFALLGLMVGVSAKKFAQRAQNGPNSAFLRLLGEYFRGNAGGGAVLGEFFRANRCCARSCRRCGALQAAAMGVLRHAKPSSGVSSACRSFGWRHSPRLVAMSSQFAVVSWPNCRPIGGKESKNGCFG